MFDLIQLFKNWIWDVQQGKLQQLIPTDPFKKITLDLAIVRDKQHYPYDGNVITVVEMTEGATLDVYLNKQIEENMIELDKIPRVDAPFQEFWISNTVQAGKNATIVVSKSLWFDFSIQKLIKDGVDSTKTAIEGVEADIDSIKEAMGAEEVLKVVNVVEVKGGAVAVETDTDDTEKSNGTTSYVLLKTLNVPALSPPANITVLKYALQVSVEFKATNPSYYAYVKIDIDDVELAVLSTKSTSYIWRDRAKEVSNTAHEVKIYGKSEIAGGPTCYVRGCSIHFGIGTIGTSETKLVTIATSGDGKLLFEVSARAKETSKVATVVGKFDDDAVDQISKTATSGTSGSLISNTESLAGMALSEIEYYAYTTGVHVPAFLTYGGSKTLKAKAL